MLKKNKLLRTIAFAAAGGIIGLLFSFAYIAVGST